MLFRPQISRAVRYFDRRARKLVPRYLQMGFADVHPELAGLATAGPILVLDLGAGSGRDTVWLREHGHEVVAVEPSPAMRRLALDRHGTLGFMLDDSAPDLARIKVMGRKFDLILATGVWHVLPPIERTATLLSLGDMLEPDGRIEIAVRYGPETRGLVTYAEEDWVMAARARYCGLAVESLQWKKDLEGRYGVRWQVATLGHNEERPADFDVLGLGG